MPLSAAERANQELVDCLIAEGALWSPALIAAFRATPRHRFLDRVFQYQTRTDRWREVLTRDPGPEELRILYADRALITHLGRDRPGEAPVPTSSSSQPSLMAQMLEDLNLTPGLRVLEIGSGTGYNAALLAHVVGPGRVLSIDVDRNVLAEAWDHLRSFPERRVELRHADGRLGCPEAAPFDRIMVTAATPDLEPAWLEQLAPDGYLSAPLALAPGLAYIVRGTVRDGIFDGKLLRAAYFMPLHTEGETGAENETGPAPWASFKTVPAPWGDWFERRRSRTVWLRFSQSLAFFGLLRGLHVHFRGEANGQPAFGVSDPEDQDVCWFGTGQWQIGSAKGHDLGHALWRAFLEAGGPWPTEFRLRAGPDQAIEPSGSVLAFHRNGRRCRQLWELSEQRERHRE
jgi:protein-L-isoaspartate(D-aspartate) O-methyltransferase